LAALWLLCPAVQAAPAELLDAPFPATQPAAAAGADLAGGGAFASVRSGTDFGGGILVEPDNDPTLGGGDPETRPNAGGAEYTLGTGDPRTTAVVPLPAAAALAAAGLTTLLGTRRRAQAR